MSEVEDSVELAEDIEVVGPGQMLAEAREKLGLTQQQVADKLNFRISLVNDIETETFDPRLPETFNRGYLRNYAKLVNVAEEEIFASYEQLNVAKKQGAELLSFSKGTEKQAENNLIMWISYLILAILIGSTIMWWLQNKDNQPQAIVDVEPAPLSDMVVAKSAPAELLTKTVDIESAEQTKAANESGSTVTGPTKAQVEANVVNEQGGENIVQQAENVTGEASVSSDVQANIGSMPETLAEVVKDDVELTKVIFTFSGDCWVNISDATGERIAWGVKKIGYVMKISGQAPFTVTLGKPERVAINFAGNDIDMKQFDVGNIAKFSLPVNP